MSPLPDLPLSAASRILADRLVQRFPDWTRYLDSHEPGGRLDLDVPSAAHGRRHRLVVRERAGFLRGYEGSPVSAAAILAFLERHFDVNAELAREIRKLTGLEG